MPPLPPLVGAIKCVLGYTGPGGATAVNVLHMIDGGSTGEFTAADMQSAANIMFESFTVFTGDDTGPITSICPTWTLNDVTAFDMGGSEMQAVSNMGNSPGRAESGTQALPPNCCICLSWKVNLSYRGGKPRTYLPGIPNTAEAAIGGSQLTSGAQQTAATGGNNLIAAIGSTSLSSGTGLQLGTVSYIRAGVPRPGGPQFVPYQSCVCHSRIDSQRRRLGKEITT